MKIKFVINSEELGKLLEIANYFVPTGRRLTMPITENFLIETNNGLLSIAAKENKENGIRISTELGSSITGSGEAVVFAKKFKKGISTLANQPLVIEIDDDILKTTHSVGFFKMPTDIAEDFPMLDVNTYALETEEALEMPLDSFLQQIKTLEKLHTDYVADKGVYKDTVREFEGYHLLFSEGKMAVQGLKDGKEKIYTFALPITSPDKSQIFSLPVADLSNTYKALEKLKKLGRFDYVSISLRRESPSSRTAVLHFKLRGQYEASILKSIRVAPIAYTFEKLGSDVFVSLDNTTATPKTTPKKKMDKPTVNIKEIRDAKPKEQDKPKVDETKIVNRGYWQLIQLLNKNGVHSENSDSYWGLGDNDKRLVKKSIKAYLALDMQTVRDVYDSNYSKFNNTNAVTASARKRHLLKDRVKNYIENAMRAMLNEPMFENQKDTNNEKDTTQKDPMLERLPTDTRQETLRQGKLPESQKDKEKEEVNLVDKLFTDSKIEAGQGNTIRKEAKKWLDKYQEFNPSVSDLYETTEVIRKNDRNDKINILHFTQASQSLTQKLKGNNDYFTVNNDDVYNLLKDGDFSGVLVRLSGLGGSKLLDEAQLRERGRKMQIISDNLEALPTSNKVFIRHYIDSAIDVEKIDTDEFLDLAVKLTSIKKIEDLVIEIQETLRQGKLPESQKNMEEEEVKQDKPKFSANDEVVVCEKWDSAYPIGTKGTITKKKITKRQASGEYFYTVLTGINKSGQRLTATLPESVLCFASEYNPEGKLPESQKDTEEENPKLLRLIMGETTSLAKMKNEGFNIKKYKKLPSDFRFYLDGTLARNKDFSIGKVYKHVNEDIYYFIQNNLITPLSIDPFQALSEGKPVPAEVLAEYPELDGNSSELYLSESEIELFDMVDANGDVFSVEINYATGPNQKSTYQILRKKKEERVPRKLFSVGNIQGVNKSISEYATAPISKTPKELPQKPNNAKQNFEMTFEEYAAIDLENLKKRFKKPTESQIKASRSYAREDHLKFIKRALTEGKPVPAEVLAEYGELEESKEETPAVINNNSSYKFELLVDEAEDKILKFMNEKNMNVNRTNIRKLKKLMNELEEYTGITHRGAIQLAIDRIEPARSSATIKAEMKKVQEKRNAYARKPRIDAGAYGRDMDSFYHSLKLLTQELDKAEKQEGKPVPAEVLAEYGELEVKPQKNTDMAKKKTVNKKNDKITVQNFDALKSPRLVKTEDGYLLIYTTEGRYNNQRNLKAATYDKDLFYEGSSGIVPPNLVYYPTEVIEYFNGTHRESDKMSDYYRGMMLKALSDGIPVPLELAETPASIRRELEAIVLKKDPKPTPATNEKQAIEDAIAGLEVALEYTEGKEKKSIEDALLGLKTALEFL